MAPSAEAVSHKRPARSQSSAVLLAGDEPARKRQEQEQNPASSECASLAPLLPHLPSESK